MSPNHPLLETIRAQASSALADHVLTVRELRTLFATDEIVLEVAAGRLSGSDVYRTIISVFEQRYKPVLEAIRYLPEGENDLPDRDVRELLSRHLTDGVITPRELYILDQMTEADDEERFRAMVDAVALMEEITDALVVSGSCDLEEERLQHIAANHNFSRAQVDRVVRGMLRAHKAHDEGQSRR